MNNNFKSRLLCLMLVTILIGGCATSVPVIRKFPEAPGKLVMEACPHLQKLQDDAKLSDISKIVTVNYGSYYECAVKLDAWIKWYEIQKAIYEDIK